MTGIIIVAEAGINHNGDLSIAKEMIDAAGQCGADVIKFQTFKAVEFISDPKQEYTYTSQGKQVTESMLEMFKRYEFTPEQWIEIIAYCHEKKIEFSSTAQNKSDLEFLMMHADLPFIKIGSDDLTNIELLADYGSKKKPVVISAGMSYPGEIDDALKTLKHSGCDNITILHCISEYPVKAKNIHLAKIPIIRDAFGVRAGFSDHSIGSAAAVGAVCFGAVMIEKHFTLDSNMKGPDHWFSAGEKDFKQYVSDIRFISKAIGKPVLVPSPKEFEMREIARRKIVAKSRLAKGSILKKKDIEFKRSEDQGLAPKESGYLLGRRLKYDIQKGRTILLHDFE